MGWEKHEKNHFETVLAGKRFKYELDMGCTFRRPNWVLDAIGALTNGRGCICLKGIPSVPSCGPCVTGCVLLLLGFDMAPDALAFV